MLLPVTPAMTFRAELSSVIDMAARNNWTVSDAGRAPDSLCKSVTSATKGSQLKRILSTQHSVTSPADYTLASFGRRCERPRHLGRIQLRRSAPNGYPDETTVLARRP